MAVYRLPIRDGNPNVWRSNGSGRLVYRLPIRDGNYP